MGKSTVYFRNKPRIISTYTIAGPKEAKANVGKYIHEKLVDDRYGEDTFEKAECKML